MEAVAAEREPSGFEMSQNVSSSNGKQRRRQNNNERANEQLGFAAIINEFAEETGVFGLSLLRSGRSRLENVFWIVCTLFFAFCTVRDLNTLTTSFLRQETLSLTSQMTNTSIILDPAPTFEFSHALEKFDFQDLRAEIIENFIQMFENVSNDEVSSVVVGDDLFQLILSMLISMVENELRIIFPSENYGDPDSSYAFQYKGNDNYLQIRSAVEQVYDRLAAQNVSFARLFKFIAAQICAKLDFTIQLNVDSVKNKSSYSICTPSNALGMDNTSVVVSLWNAPLVFSESYETVLLSWNANDNALQKVFVDFYGTPQTFSERENAFLTLVYSKPERLRVSLGISAIFVRVEEKTSQPCSKTVVRYDCKQRCYISSFVDQCGCYPLYFAAGYPPTSRDVGLCPYGQRNRTAGHGRIDYLVSCRSTNQSEEQKLSEICRAECLPDCRTLTFVTTIGHEPPSNMTRNELVLEIESFTFPLIEERLALNFDGFISQFGGVLGLYIGISFASLVHIPIFAIRKGAEHMRRRSAERKSSTHGAEENRGDDLIEIASTFSLNDAEQTARESRQCSQEIRQQLDAMMGRFHVIERRIEAIEHKL